MARICWYCAFAFREDPSNVTCSKNNYQYRARTFCCNEFLECSRKKYAPEEQTKI